MKPERRTLITFLALTAVICFCMGIILSFNHTAHAQSTEEYAGTRECRSCHRRIENRLEDSAHSMTLFAVQEYPEAVVADFTVGEDVRVFQFPGEDEPRPFTLDDIAYGVGSGRTAQRYLIEAENTYRVLPAQWNVSLSEWQSFPLAEGGDWNENCATCHTTGYDATHQEWVEEAVTCEACHGAGLAHVEIADDAGGSIDDGEMENILASITTMPPAETCGSCHTAWTEDDPVHATNTYEMWHTSPHAQVVSDMGEAALTCSGCHVAHPGDEEDDPHLLATENTCLSCHENGADVLIRGDSVVANVTGKPSAHYEEGLTCESCHDVHLVEAVPDDPEMEVACTSCHNDLTQTTALDFVNGAQEKTVTRLVHIESVMDENSPEWVQTVVATLQSDGSGGLHNIAYTSRLLDAVETELGIKNFYAAQNVPVVTATDPTECAECHADVHTTWQNSLHASASLGAEFQRAYAENGQPSYCMTCHASGYDPNTQTYVFEGVVCSSCHIMEDGTEHPPAPMPIADSPELCGRCHSGEHAPSYNEWLVSDHSTFNVDCIDCHVAHDNGLRLGDVNATCSDCHEDAMQDEVHMGEDLTCVDCHMTRIHDDGESIHHTMFSDPQTCADCHGNIHTLELDPTRDLDDDAQQLIANMEEELGTLEAKANTNLQSGIVGGAIGSLVLMGFLFIAIRLGRIR